MLLYNHTLPMDAHRSILSWERSWKINFKFIKTSAFAFVLVPPHGHISPSDFMKTIWLTVEHRVELHTSTTVLKYWKGISSFYLNDMFMPSLNNCNTRSQIRLDIQLCRTNKGQKSILQEVEYVELRQKSSCNYSFFHAQF